MNLDEVREKYRAERDKRIRADGDAQYLETGGEFAHFANDDPYASEPPPREPLNDEIDVVVIGGGFSGMQMAARLLERGVDNIRIIEAAADFGGTWYWNRYPGAQCDIESYMYLPLLEETGYIPKEKYSYAPEIFEHAQRIAKHYGLYDHVCFQTRVKEMHWDESSLRWIVTTDRGDAMRSRFVVVSTGPVSRPKLPNIPGINDFKGHSFHTSRWDFSYTGGDHNGNLEKLADQRVAIIGTGATAIQCVPHVGASAKELLVFQRTPSSVDWRRNKPTDPEWAASLQPGWQRKRRENFDSIAVGEPVEEDLVDDGWTEMFKELNLSAIAPVGVARDFKPTPEMLAQLAEMAEMADLKEMTKIRSRIDQVIEDPNIAEALKPWYRRLCKRPCFNDGYLETFNRPNVKLIDVAASHGVERITEKGLVANGQEYEVDAIIWATGFEVTTPLRRRIDFDIVGEGGQSLFDYWSDGFKTLHGHSSRGFPNWFYIGLGQNGLSLNMTAVFNDQAVHIAYIIDEVRNRGARAVQPTKEAEEAWVAEIRSLALGTTAFFEQCTPGYYNGEGNTEHLVSSAFTESYAPGINAFNNLLAKWRAGGDLDGLELTS
ncbi:flavin-containing monooxygenase [Mycobacterium sp. C31M]